MLNQQCYESFYSLQCQGFIKFKSGIPYQILTKIRRTKIMKFSIEKLNMKLQPKQISNKQCVKQNLKETQDQSLHNDLTLTQTFSYIKEMNLEELSFFEESFDGKLFQTLETVSFKNLQYLELNNCELNSVQFLTLLEIPCLKKLFLNQNHITNLNSFAKMYFPNLYWIQLISNQIKDVKGLNRLLSSKKIALLQVSEKHKNQNKDAFTYLPFWFFKLPFEHINYIRKKEKYLDFNKKSRTKALQKYPYVSFR